MDQIELGPLIIKLSAMFGASVLIERFLVIINLTLNRLFIIQSSSKYHKIDELESQLALDIKSSEEDKIIDDLELVGDDDPREIEPNPNLEESRKRESNFDVLPIKAWNESTNSTERFELLKKSNKVRKEFWMQIFGTIIAIIVCYYSDFSIWVFVTSIINNIEISQVQSKDWEYAFTGIIIGGGSKPINFLMNFLINRKLEVNQEKVKAEVSESVSTFPGESTGPVPPVAVPNIDIKLRSIEQIVGFKYDGGDRPERLENTHIFKKPIDLIVYHHTAMHSDSPFEELVKEFDRKGWLTGYNCVVLKDGTIHNLCRWDRFGNHARPHNGHSLGIAMQGNFETSPSVPYSNHNGRYGIKAPTNEQVDSTARITALWALMHEINAEFPKKAGSSPKHILPHNLIANKACPGNNFPYKGFQSKVKHYHDNWKTDAEFQRALAEFKEMPMVMPKT